MMKIIKGKQRKKGNKGKAASPSFNISSFPGPDDITRVELPNGIVVLARENFNSPAVVIDGSLQAGALYESREKAGLARFVASSLMRGTKKHSFEQIYEQVESVGARLSIGAGTHTTGFSGKGLAEDSDFLLSMLAESLRQPTFPLDQVERLRGEFLTGLAIRAHDTGAMASMAFDELLYPNHPYGVADDGYPETVSSITRDELVNFHAKHYGPRGMILVIVGAVKTSEAVALAQKHFGDWKNDRQPARAVLSPTSSLSGIQRTNIIIAGKTQCDIVLGCIGPKRNDDDYLNARMANNIFGVFGMYGRLGDIVREKHGLAYYAYSQVTGGLGPGPWQMAAGVNPKNVELAINLIHKEMERLIKTKVTADELAENKSNFVGRMPLSLETNEGVAGQIESMELYDLGLDYLQRYPALISAITRDSVQAAAAKYLDPKRYAVAVAGPEMTNEK